MEFFSRKRNEEKKILRKISFFCLVHENQDINHYKKTQIKRDTHTDTQTNKLSYNHSQKKTI